MLEYFKPDNNIALLIVVLIWIMGVSWWATLASSTKLFFRGLGAVNHFSEAVEEFVSLQKEWTGQTSTRPTVDPGEAFDALLSEDLKDERFVVPHVRAIFVAGCVEGRLDSGDLLRSTERSILDLEAVSRGRLSVFLILGLLGTLFGLADSIVALLNLMRVTNDPTNSMTTLLSGLKGAFAPSLAGVTVTVIGTMLHFRHQRTTVIPLLSRLRIATYQVWVPRLYPTTQQVAIEAAQRMLVETQKVAKFATEIEKDSSSLQRNLSSAAMFTESFQKGMETLAGVLNSSAESTGAIMAQLGSHLDRFRQAAELWSSFETKVVGFHSRIEEAQGKLVDNSKSVRDLVNQQGTSITKLVDTVQKANIDALNEVKKSLLEVSARMTALQVPFADAAAQMVDSARNLQLNAKTSNETMIRLITEMAERSANAPSVVHVGGQPDQVGQIATAKLDGLVSALHGLNQNLRDRQNPRRWRFWQRH